MLAAELAMSTVRNLKDIFLLDSACTRHMSHDKRLFKKIDRSKEINVYVGDGKALKVVGEGDIVLNIETPSGKAKRCTVKNVLYVPELSHNLLSISKISSSGKCVNFSDKFCKIMNDDKVVAFGRKIDSLYVLAEKTSRNKMFAGLYDSNVQKELVTNVGYCTRNVAISAAVMTADKRKIRCRFYPNCLHYSCRT